MLSFEFDGDEQMLCCFLSGLLLFILVELLGGVESLIFYVVMMMYVGMVFEVCVVVGILEMFLCILIGIEDGEDLIVDLENGFWVVNEE